MDVNAHIQEESRNVTKMVSFLVFSISPALQLLPFVFNDVQGAWSEWKYYAFLECIDEAGDVSLLPEEEQIAARQKCDGNFPYVVLS